MIFNQTAVYGLRAMVTLARLAPGESITSAALSAATGVPQQYLSKVMRKFVLAKLVQSRRGHGGGFSLRKPPSSIRIADVFEAVDLKLDTGCAFSFTACDLDNPCGLHQIWKELKEYLAQWANQHTLADTDGGAPFPVG